MIERYEIKKENGSEVLYIHINMNYEFAKINFRKKSKSFHNSIIDFLKNNKIAFTGSIIAIVANGLLVGKVILNNSNDLKNIATNYVVEQVVNDEINDSEVSYLAKKKLETLKKAKEEMNQAKEIPKNNNTTIVVSKAQETNKTSQNNNVSNVVKEEPVKDENIYVKIKRSNGTIINVELEEYIVGVVAAEMPAEFNTEALKCQAIIARTYALKAISNNKTLTDNESTQSYKDNKQLQSMWGNSYTKYYNKIMSAAKSTKGMYLSYNGQYIEAVYHSTSNTKTESSYNVWGNYYPYLITVESAYDTSNKSFQVDKVFSYDNLSKKLGIDINIETIFDITSYTESNRVKNIKINDKNYTGIELRNILGLRSTDFSISKDDNQVIFTTKGYGHGVGLSQYGANGMAKAGYTYTQILNHYYPGTTIIKK